MIDNRKILLNRTTFAQFILVINPLIDIIFYLLNSNKIDFHINQILRVCIMLVALLFLKRSKSFLAIFGYAFILFLGMFVQYEMGMTLSIGKDFGFVVKLWSALILYYLYYEIFLDDIGKIQKMMVSMNWSAIIIECNIFANFFFGIGRQNYATSNSGRMKGYLGFLSGNSITTVSLTLLLAVNIVLYFKRKKYIPILANVVALFLVFSKASILGTILFIILIYQFDLYCANIRYKGRKIVYGVFLTIGGFLSLLPLLSGFIRSIQRWSATQQYQDIFTMLTSNRGMQILLIKKYYIDKLDNVSHIIQIIFGAGYSKTNYILNSHKKEFLSIEWDFHGIYYYCGVIVLILMILFICNILRKGYSNIKNKNEFEGIFLLTIIVCLLYALIGGHVLYESMTLQYLVVFLAYIAASSKKD